MSDVEQYVYGFVRQDIPEEQQMVQVGHALYQMSVSYRPEESVPNLVLIGIPNVESLNRVLLKLKQNQIPHYVWVEPDNDMGFTAIATVPISGEQRQVLANYRLLKFGRGTGKLVTGSNPNLPTKVLCAVCKDSIVAVEST